MKTKIKKRIVSVVAFMSLVVSMVGILPLGFVCAGELKNNTSGTLKFETSGGTGDDAYTQTFTVSSGGVYCMYDKSSDRPYLISASDFSVEVVTVDSKGKTSSRNYHATQEKCDHYTVYSYNLYDFSGKKISGYSYDHDSAYNYLAGAGKPSDDSLDFDGYVVANGTSYLTETKILYDMNHDNGGYSSGGLKPYFYLASSQSEMVNVINRFYSAKWVLTWKLPEGLDASKTRLEVYLSNNARKDSGISFLSRDKEFMLSNGYYSFFTKDIYEPMMDSYSDWRPRKNDMFYLHVRSVNSDGTSSDWTIFQCSPDGKIGKVYGRNDATWDKTEEYKGETGDYSDGTKTDSNGGYYNPDVGYNPEDKVSSTGTNIDDYYGDVGTVDKGSLVQILRSCVDTVGNVPALISEFMSWIPADILALIAVGIGLIVVVGVIKWLL